MAKKLQVFISSTFSDLREERQAAVAGVLLAGHIPAGMELFTAGDQEQLEVIKRWIQESDIYMLILGARYGSIEPTSGLSYTELEYDYASELKKPSFAVVMDGAMYTARIANHADAGGEAHARFRAKVLGRISSPFESTDQMKLGIVTALRDLGERPGLVGWVRSTEIPNLQPLVAEIASLRGEGDRLRAALAKQPRVRIDDKPLAGLDESISLTCEFRDARYEERSAVAACTWGELFGFIAPKLAEFPADSTLCSKVGKYVAVKSGKYLGPEPRDFKISEFEWGTVRTQFEALGLVTFQHAESVSKSMHLYWHATDAGKNLGLRLRAVATNKLV